MESVLCMEDKYQKNYPVVTNILNLMKIKKISIDELSVGSGIIVEDLLLILNNRKLIRPFQIVAVARVLDTDINALFEEPQDV